MTGVNKIVHTCVWVSDIEVTKKFYIEGLGLHHTWGFTGGDGVMNFYISGDGGAEIQFKYRPEDTSNSATPQSRNESGMDHLAMSVDDVEEIVQGMVEKTKCKIVVDIFQNDETGVKAAFIEDPDGHVVELIQYLDHGTNSKV
tara:strand:- start:105 stop:533 length:429 start_codon:yes stop_codon:yes gene_type:complete